MFPDSKSNPQSNSWLYFLSPYRYEYKSEFNISRSVDNHSVGNSVFIPLIEFCSKKEINNYILGKLPRAQETNATFSFAKSSNLIMFIE